MLVKFVILLLTLSVTISCRKEVSDDQITKTQLRERVQQAQAVQNLSEEQMVEEFNKKEPEFKEKVANLIFEALNNDTILKMLEKPKAQKVIKQLLAKEETRVNALKAMSEEDLKKLMSHSDVQALLAKFQSKPTVAQFENFLASLSDEEIQQLTQLPKVKEILQNSMKDPEVRNQVITNLSKDEITQAMSLPSVQIAIYSQVAKIIKNNNDYLLTLIQKGNEVFDNLKISFKKETGATNKLKPNTSDLYLKFVLSIKNKKISCNDIEDTDLYWKDLLALMSQKQKLLGLGANFYENMIKSCLAFERLKKSMDKCRSLYTEDVELLCKNNLK